MAPDERDTPLLVTPATRELVKVAMLNLTAGGLSGGYKKYLQGLGPLLNANSGVSELLQVVPPGQETLPGLGTQVWSWSDGEQWRGFPQLKRRVRVWKPDVVFVPTARFLDCGAPCVCMVRNMEPMLPPTFRDGLATWAKHRLGAVLARRACDNSARVVAVSEFVRDFLVRDWKLDSAKVGVVYHGVDQPAAAIAPTAKLVALQDAPFLFAAGSLLPYRGLEDAIAALAQADLPVRTLAIAGDGSAAYRERMQQLAASLGVSDRVRWLGLLTEREMSWAYTNGAAFLMTSRVEACPNTALEALSCGALCISTRSLPMPEFFRQSALYFDAGNATQLADQIRHAFRLDEHNRQLLRESARERSQQFSWQRTASATIEQLTLATKSG